MWAFSLFSGGEIVDLKGYKTIIFNVLKIIVAIAVYYGFADFSPDIAVDAFIQNVAAFCILAEAVVSNILRVSTKTPGFNKE